MKDHNTASSVVMERCNVCSTEQSEMSSPQFITFQTVHFHSVQNLHLVEIKCYVNREEFISLEYLYRRTICDNRNEVKQNIWKEFGAEYSRNKAFGQPNMRVLVRP